MVKKFVISLSLIVCACFNLCAEITFNRLDGAVKTFWSDTNGLPSNSILDVEQDEIGYIWLASYDGLMRFDGTTFTTINEKDYGFTGVSPRVLTRNGNALWIGTNETGLYCYENSEFTEYKIDAGLPNLSIREIAFDKQNNLWVGTADGLAFISASDLENKAKLQPVLDENGNSFGIVSLILPVDNVVYVANKNYGLKKIVDGKMSNVVLKGGTTDYIFSSAFLDTDGIIWFGTSTGTILKVKDETIIDVINFPKLKGSAINAFVRTESSAMYVASDSGILNINANGMNFFGKESGLPDTIVSAFCQDFEGNLWIAFEHGGIAKFSHGRFIDLATAESIPATTCNSVLEDEYGNIWIANDDGIICIKSESVPATRSAHIDAFLKRIKGKRVRQIREENGDFYFATYSDDGLLILKKDGTIKSISKNQGLPNTLVRFSYRDNQNNLWVGTTAGPAILVDKTNEIITLTQDDGLPNLFILCVAETSNGNFWLGTDGGGAVFVKVGDLKTQGKNAIKVQNVFTKENGLSGNVVFRVVLSPLGNLWFCTGEGLDLYRNEQFYNLRKSLNLEKQSVFNVMCDIEKNLWIVTAKTLVVLNEIKANELATNAHTKTVGIRRYNSLDGLNGQLAANAWGHVSKSGRLFFPTQKGVAICDKKFYVTNKFPPPVVIESFFCDDKKIPINTNEVKVEAGTKRMTFNFAALSFTIPQRVSFEYMLEGYDKNWKSCGTNREIAYTNLFPKNYTFKVRAINNDGIINEKGSMLNFSKEPFFYETAWFYLLVVIGIFALIRIFFRLRLRALQVRAEELDKKVKEKTHELAEEKEKSDKLLRNTLPIPVIDEIIQTGKFSPKMYPAASVLFSDIVNFTSWASEIPAEKVIEDLTKLFTVFDKIMDKHGCERIKTLGDGYMACCGMRGEADHAVRLVQAATEMLQALESEKANGKINSYFKIKIGIASGKITGGIVGERKYIFDIFGDVVNTAFRLQGISAPMTCTISAETADLVKNDFTLCKNEAQELKGKGLCTTYSIC